jgi:hypothetical protein
MQLPPTDSAYQILWKRDVLARGIVHHCLRHDVLQVLQPINLLECRDAGEHLGIIVPQVSFCACKLKVPLMWCCSAAQYYALDQLRHAVRSASIHMYPYTGQTLNGPAAFSMFYEHMCFIWVHEGAMICRPFC